MFYNGEGGRERNVIICCDNVIIELVASVW